MPGWAWKPAEDDVFRPTEVLHDTDPAKDLDLGVARLLVDAAVLFAH